MNNGIIGATVYAYKHKDYGDVFLCIDTNVFDMKWFNITDRADIAIYSYHENIDEFETMLVNLQEDYVYLDMYKDYKDENDYIGKLKKTIPLQIKDFVKVAFVADYRVQYKDVSL